MPLPQFDYVVASCLADALRAWCEAPDAAFFAGGTDLLPQLRAGRRCPRRLIDIKRVPELTGIHDQDEGGLAIGASVPLADIEAHPSVLARFPLLARCAAVVGAPPLRNRATLAGNVCNASPAADTAVALLALDARVTVASTSGTTRVISIADFFVGPGRTALAPGEIVTTVVLPATAAGFRGSYLRIARRGGMDLATVGVLVACSGNGASSHRVALAAVAPTPLRVPDAEALLDREGRGAAREAAGIARLACRPITDIRGSAEYRREMVDVLTRRGVAALA